jgi:hypothetical protein
VPTMQRPSSIGLSRRDLVLCALAATLPTPASSEAAGTRVVELAIVRGKADGAQVTGSGRTAGVLRVGQGETVDIVWTSDEAATLHLHGYNIETRVAAGAKATMRFLARATGRFPVETHGTSSAPGRHVTLVYIEVHPR